MAATVEYETPPAVDLLYQMVLMAHVSPVLFLVGAAHTIKDIVLDVLHATHCTCEVDA